jgi:two-component system, cell cycle sensor histidine kinase and response regulator CckA
MGGYYSESPRELAPLVHVNTGGGQPVILVVEDDETVLRVIEKILGFAGYVVLGASSGEAAAAMARDFPGRIAVLLCDVMLKAGSGPELAGRIRDTRPDMQVIYMSGYAPEECFREGAFRETDLFLSKPLETYAVLNLVGEVIRRGDGAG